MPFSVERRTAAKRMGGGLSIGLLIGALLFASLGAAQAQADREQEQQPHASLSQSAMPVAPQGEAKLATTDEPISGVRVLTAVFYLAVLGGIAFAVAKWKRPYWPWTQARPAPGGILLQHRLRVSPQLTVVVVEVTGKRFLIASSPQAISTTPLDDPNEK